VPTRRLITTGLAGFAVSAAIPVRANTLPNSKLILKSLKALPPIGMGTWLTFNVQSSGREFETRKKVLAEFLAV